jgi:ABC-type glycerol-3-phosphate transport system substrate-binding protein
MELPDISKMRPFQLGLLAAFLIAAVIGLIVFATYRSNPQGDAGIDPVTMWGVLPERDMHDVLLELSKTYPIFEKVTYVYKNPNSFSSDFTESLALGNGPDILLVEDDFILPNTQKIRLIGGSITQPRTFRDTYLEVAEPYLVEGGSLMVPIIVDPLVMFYNRTLLNSAGVATPPSSWEEVAALSPRLTKRNSSSADIEIATIPFGSYGNVPHARDILSTLFFQSGSNITTRKGTSIEVTLDPAKAASALRFYTEFANPLTSAYSWNSSLPNAFTQFVAGDLVFYPAFFSERVKIKTGSPNLNFDVTDMPKPQLASSRVATASVYGIVLPRSSKNQADVLLVLSTLANEDVSKAFAAAFSMVPARRSLISGNVPDAFIAVGNRAALTSKIWLSPAPPVTDSIFGGMVDSVRSGFQSPDEAVKTGIEELNSALQ